MSELAKIERVQTPAEPPRPDSMVSMLERVLMDPSVPVERLGRLLELQDKERMRQAKVAFSAAMAEMQCNLPVVNEKGGITNNAGKVQSTYAKWADINEAIGPVLRDHGFSLTFKIATPDKVTVTGILTHKDGHSEDTSITLPIDSSGSKNAVQAVASSVQYGKRYTAGALLNLTSRAKEDADDDGQAAGKPLRPAISAEQARLLRSEMRERGVDEAKFCEFIDIGNLETLATDLFEQALAKVRMKPRKTKEASDA